MKETMSKQCARTCMKCEEQNRPNVTTTIAPPPPTQSSCIDIEKDCAKYAYLCLNIHYFDFLTKNCGKTCNRCNYIPQVHPHHGHCIDKTKPDGTSDCPSEVSLCNNPVYHDLMTYECPKTCGRC
uniref:ShKT domain-containing protein n=1 Tax=Panagrolaimus davidi TaxID=227884 RepID=A0A914QQK6_9BILA